MGARHVALDLLKRLPVLEILAPRAVLRLVQWIVVFGRALHITKRDFTVGDMQSAYNQMNSEVTLQMQICRCFVDAS